MMSCWDYGQEHLAVETRTPTHPWGQNTWLPPFGKIIWQFFKVQIHILFNPKISLLGYKVTKVFPARLLVGAKQTTLKTDRMSMNSDMTA